MERNQIGSPNLHCVLLHRGSELQEERIKKFTLRFLIFDRRTCIESGDGGKGQHGTRMPRCGTEQQERNGKSPVTASIK